MSFDPDEPRNEHGESSPRITDAAPSRDPTGTADLRRAFERELKDRWTRLDRCLNRAIGVSDVLSLSPNGAMALISAADRTKQFRSWLDELLSHLIVAGGDWMKPYLDEAGERASSRAAGLDPRKAAGGGLPTAPRIAGHTTDAYDPDEPRDKTGEWTSTGTERLFRGVGGLGRPYTGKQWGPDSVYATGNIENASIYGMYGGVHAVTLAKGLRVVSAESQKALEISKSADPKEHARKLGVDVIHNKVGQWKNGVSPHEAIVFDPKNAATSDLTPIETAKVEPMRAAYRKANEERGVKKAALDALTDSATEDTILVLATSELQGICDAYAQQATRIAAHAALVRWRPAKAARGIRQLTASVGLARSRMMADYLVVKAHAAATLDAFREAGVRHVGTVAETLPHVRVGDAGPEDEPRDKEGKWTSGSRAKAGGETGINEYHYKGGQFLPSTTAPPGTWRVKANGKAQNVGSQRELVEPGKFEFSPTPFARSIFNLMGAGSYTNIDNNGRASVNPNINWEYVGGSPDEKRHARFKNLATSKEEFSQNDLINQYNSGARWMHLEPNEGVEIVARGKAAHDSLDTLFDAARKTPQHRHPVHGRFITEVEATREWGRRASGEFGKAPKTYNRSIKHRKALRAAAAIGEEEINIQTAGDDRVCQACQTISANGPYPIGNAMDLIPAHPRCRCVYVPASLEGNSQV